MKIILFINIIYWCVFTTISAQEYKGKVVDEYQQPIPYANVILQQKNDSTFIAGSVTDKNGYFNLKVKTANLDNLLKVSFIGYTTQIVDAMNGYSGIIQLSSLAQNLQEVIVKGHKPVYEMKAGILTAKIKGSSLNNIGTASEVLKQLPFITGKDNTIEVFGRGTPLIYLNNRLVRNTNELNQLKSQQIKDIQIIMNPGSQYDTETDAVIKITTLRPVNEGIGGSLSVRGKQKKKFVYDDQLDLTYRKSKLDAFSMVYYSRNKWSQQQTNRTSFVHNSTYYHTDERGKIGFQSKQLELLGGANYFINEHQSLGIKYTYSKDFKTPAYLSYFNNSKENNKHFPFYSHNDILQGGYSHYINGYYQKEFNNKTSLHIDGTFMNKRNLTNTTAWNDKNGIETTIPSQSNSKSNLYALKAWGSMPFMNGTLELGTEGTLTDSRQNYFMENEDFIDDLPDNLSESDQIGLSVYASYARNWKHFSLNGGLRYEHVDFTYFSNGAKNNDASKKYNNLFPSLSLSFQKGKLSMSLSYRTTVTRPSYWQLRSNMSYNNNYSYEGGNPKLQRNINHNYGLLLSYGDFLLDCAYRYKKDEIMLYQQHFTNKPIILSSFMNYDRQSFSVDFSYSPTIAIWKPSFTVGLFAQNMHYKGTSYNSPMFTYMWKNLIILPNAWTITLNVDGNSYGDTRFTSGHSSFNSEVSIRKSIKKTLDIYLGALDLFNTYRDQWAMNIEDIYFHKWNKPDYRCVYLKIVLKFNKASDTYKGGSAGQSERNRL